MLSLMQTYNDLAEDTVILRFNIDGRLVGFLAASATALSLNFLRLIPIERVWRDVLGSRRDARSPLTTSSSTSPAAKDSPSDFFHEATPPSVIVGDIAGMRIAVEANRTCSSANPISQGQVSQRHCAAKSEGRSERHRHRGEVKQGMAQRDGEEVGLTPSSRPSGTEHGEELCTAHSPKKQGADASSAGIGRQ